MENPKLTIEKLMAMEPHSIFASGYANDAPGGINMLNSGRRLRWVAVRGGIHDWAIYCGLATNTDGYIRDVGDKIHNEMTIRSLVPCTDEAFKMYRH